VSVGLLIISAKSEIRWTNVDFMHILINIGLSDRRCVQAVEAAVLIVMQEVNWGRPAVRGTGWHTWKW
jgi:hypothetical protein